MKNKTVIDVLSVGMKVLDGWEDVLNVMLGTVLKKLS